MDWDTCRAAFDPDGSLRDLVVLATTVEDWNRLSRIVQPYADGASLTISEVDVPIFDFAIVRDLCYT